MVLLLCGLLTVPAGPYSAVVVDATTNRPLEAVSVRDPDSNTGTTTTAQGTFTLATTPKRVALSRLGYASLTLTLAPGSRLDTLRLLPQNYVLGDVVVRTPRSFLMSSGKQGGQQGGFNVFPGQSLATLLSRPEDLSPDQPCVVTQVRLYLQEKPKQGRVRVRLTTLERATAAGKPAQPGSQDILPIPFVFSTEQLAAARKGELLIDLSAYNILLPPDGLCVVLEALPTNPDDKLSGISRDEKNRVTVHLSRNNGQRQDLPGKDFPVFTYRLNAGGTTWFRVTARPTWQSTSASHDALRTDVQLLLY